MPHATCSTCFNCCLVHSLAMMQHVSKISMRWCIMCSDSCGESCWCAHSRHVGALHHISMLKQTPPNKMHDTYNNSTAAEHAHTTARKHHVTGQGEVWQNAARHVIAHRCDADVAVCLGVLVCMLGVCVTVDSYSSMFLSLARIRIQHDKTSHDTSHDAKAAEAPAAVRHAVTHTHRGQEPS